MTMNAHHSLSTRTDEWLTPPEIVKALGVFDLDPCASLNRPWNTAVKHYTIDDDGLSKLWQGRIWLNPPYGRETGKWLKRLAHHGNGIALVFARTETKMFFESVWGKARGFLFVKGRLSFYYPNGRKSISNSGGPSVLIAYGHENTISLEQSGIEGQFIRL